MCTQARLTDRACSCGRLASRQGERRRYASRGKAHPARLGSRHNAAHCRGQSTSLHLLAYVGRARAQTWCEARARTSTRRAFQKRRRKRRSRRRSREMHSCTLKRALGRCQCVRARARRGGTPGAGIAVGDAFCARARARNAGRATARPHARGRSVCRFVPCNVVRTRRSRRLLLAVQLTCLDCPRPDAPAGFYARATYNRRAPRARYYTSMPGSLGNARARLRRQSDKPTPSRLAQSPAHVHGNGKSDNSRVAISRTTASGTSNPDAATRAAPRRSKAPSQMHAVQATSRVHMEVRDVGA